MNREMVRLASIHPSLFYDSFCPWVCLQSVLLFIFYIRVLYFMTKNRIHVSGSSFLLSRYISGIDILNLISTLVLNTSIQSEDVLYGIEQQKYMSII